jgi:predicted Zn-dependent peptidase
VEAVTAQEITALAAELLAPGQLGACLLGPLDAQALEKELKG